jgi:hypothetical protein
MFEIHPSSWPFAVDGSDPRNQFHETALREARVATEAQGVTLASPAHEGFVTRLRLALTGGPAVTEPCNCPA